MIQIFYLPLQNNVWTQTDSEMLFFVSDKRAEHILRLKSDIDKRLALYASLLTRSVISKYTGLSNSALEFETEKNKKPRLKSPDTYLSFNYSHTDNAILFGICDFGSIGVDIESSQRKIPVNIMPKAFHPAEIAYISELPLEEHSRFFEIWTKKEAYIKRTGTGFSENQTSLNTLSDDVAASLFTWRADKYICSACIETFDKSCSLSFSDLNISEIDENYVRSCF